MCGNAVLVHTYYSHTRDLGNNMETDWALEISKKQSSYLVCFDAQER
jgi:hypothetical protein